MSESEHEPLLLPLDSPAELSSVGGKAKSLGTLIRAGLPTPGGFVLTTAAYRRFVEETGIAERVAAILSDMDAADATDAARASARIRPLFDEATLPADIEAAIRRAVDDLGDIAVAVRSSATAEDLDEASFAGQMDSVLDVRGTAAVTKAVRTCWSSLWTDRAIAYRAGQGVDGDGLALAVVVQELADARAAGVLFTADPVTGSRAHTIVNAAWGLGESLVSGEVTPDVYRVDTTTGSTLHHRIGDKSVETVRTDAGARTRPVPSHRRRARVLTDEECAELARYGAAIERHYGRPMDVEWVATADGVAIVQARPITRLPDDLEQWNATLDGDFLWTSTNLGEAIPSVMTPITWSMVRIFMSEAMSISRLGTHEVSGNIGGRFYLNLTLTDSLTTALGLTEMVRDANDRVFGTRPDGLRPTRLPESRMKQIRAVIPMLTGFLRVLRPYLRAFEERVAAFPGRCAELSSAIADASTPSELAELWPSCESLLRDGSRLLAAGGRRGGGALATSPKWLLRFASESDVDAMLTTSGDGTTIASLGPLIGLDRLARGELSPAEYATQWGHRCADEFEVSVPRPAEDPAWIERRLAEASDGPDATSLLAAQERRRAEALDRFATAHPRLVKRLRRRLVKASKATSGREAGRSEVIRAFGVLRNFVCRAGKLTGQGDQVFWLRLNELRDLLGGNDSGLAALPARRRAYEHYTALPTYPTYIRGRFSPEDWAADPGRRPDVYDADTPPTPPPSGVIIGNPGSPGVVEGIARVILDVEDGHRLRPGDVLVTTVTNVGWTPLFPRAAAIVTDIGANLSHAAIVARELGVPAVVGCGTATTRIQDGDRVRVDASKGTVVVLDGAEKG
ncbi:PEP/pyruvate-binding domain-containing protein [Stackebrandtia soli]|uniref:PEP/pyruvate-binding domain-containing protein n=1 Tax=Stackebrandtia soli TaxID=1892856 RepID=UPI0039E851FB